MPGRRRTGPYEKLLCGTRFARAAIMTGRGKPRLTRPAFPGLPKKGRPRQGPAESSGKQRRLPGRMRQRRAQLVAHRRRLVVELRLADLVDALVAGRILRQGIPCGGTQAGLARSQRGEGVDDVLLFTGSEERAPLETER